MTDAFPAARRVLIDAPASRLADLTDRLVQAAQVLTRCGLAAAPWRAGEPPGTPIELTTGALAEYLDSVGEARAQGNAEPCLLISGDLVVVADLVHSPHGPKGAIWFPLPTLSPIDPLLSLLGEVATTLEAYHAHVEDDRLLLLYQSRRATERARAAVPEEYRQYVPDPPNIPAAGLIPQLLVPQEYDTRRVPAGVWWLNYWDSTQVRTVGEERVYAAPWARLCAAGDGALLLAATEEPLNPEIPDHVTRLRELVDGLALRELQERLQYAT